MAPVVQETTAGVAAAGTEEEKTNVDGRKAELTDSGAAESSNPSTLLIAQAATQGPDLSATPRPPVTRESALAPGPVRAMERPTSDVPTKSEREPVKEPSRAKADREKTEKPAKRARPAAKESPEAETDEEIPTVEPSAIPKEENVERAEPNKQLAPDAGVPVGDSTQPSSNKKPPDDSILTLTGPPSSLRTKTAPSAETNPSTGIPTAPSSNSPVPKLTAVQAMDIADIEARTRGYDLREFQLPKAEYNATNDTWSVGYAGRDSGGTKKLSVVVQDKTGKAEVKR